MLFDESVHVDRVNSTTGAGTDRGYSWYRDRRYNRNRRQKLAGGLVQVERRGAGTFRTRWEYSRVCETDLMPRD